MYSSLDISIRPWTVSRDKWNSLRTKTSCSRINWRDRYSFDRRNAKSTNFRWKCVEGPPRAGRFSRCWAKCELNRWVSSHGNLARWKGVLALMHTVRGSKIVNRITRNGVGTRGKLSCSFYAVRRTRFYEVILNECCDAYRQIYFRNFDIHSGAMNQRI